MTFVSNEISTTSDITEYNSFLLDYSTYDIERGWFYSEKQISDKEPVFPQKKKIVLKVLDGKIYGIVDKKLPTEHVDVG